MFLVSLKNPVTILYENAYRKATLIIADKMPNIGITTETLYSTSGGDEGMSIEDFAYIGTIVIPPGIIWLDMSIGKNERTPGQPYLAVPGKV